MSENKHIVSIGGFSLSLTTEEPRFQRNWDGPLEQFRISGESADIEVSAGWELEAPITGELVCKSPGLWSYYRDAGEHFFVFQSDACGPDYYKTARFDADLRRGKVGLRRSYFDGAQIIDPLEYPLDELLISQRLLDSGGLEMHSCGIFDQDLDRAYLFVGMSGAGKTTMANQWQNESRALVLSDDRILIRKEEGRYWLHGTPWHGDAQLSEQKRAPLSHIFFLEKGKKNERIAIGPAEASARLLRSTFGAIFDTHATERALGICSEIITTVPNYLLPYVPDPDVVDFLRGISP
jgi:hypothetical protein